MSPNQPKTPISSFRLDDETKERLRRSADAMGISLTEAIRRATTALDGVAEAWGRADPEMAAHVHATASREQHALGDEAVKALATYLVVRDWPSATPREVSSHRSNTYSRLAAAIVAGEAWAIRKAWPEAATEIANTRPA